MTAWTAAALGATFPTSTPGESLPTIVSVPMKVDDVEPGESDDKQRKDITVRLQYLEDNPLYECIKPIQVTPPFSRKSRTNVWSNSGPEEILNDVRGRENEFTLDNNGFCYVSAPTKFTNWSSQPAIAKEFLPEMEALLKREVDGCDEVIFYDARIRQLSDQGVPVQGMSYTPYAQQVHVDNTGTSVIEKIRSITDVQAEYHTSSRFRIINVWRPIKHPVYDCGLTISDGSKLRDSDVMECARQLQDTGDYLGPMGVARYRPGFDWYYMSLQDEPDVLLFKNYDSATEVRARLCLHTAFHISPEEVPSNAPTRESIEARALVFTRPKGMPKSSWTSLQHPLAVTPEQNQLKLIDEEHSITDRFRTNSDEGKDVKDAMLLLRRAEIQRLESMKQALTTERDELNADLKQLRWELEQSQQQISIQTAHAGALQDTIKGLEQELSLSNGDLHKRIQDLSKELADSRAQQQTRVRDEKDGLYYAGHATSFRDVHSSENALLLQHIEDQRQEIEKWKGEAMCRGSEAVSRSWQASVDEAVRREREKDSSVIKSLKEEIERSKAG